MTAESVEEAPRSLLVMLTRMEGKLDAVGKRLDDLVPRVEHHDRSITDLLLDVQRLDIQAEGREATVLRTAEALRDAKVAADAASAAEAMKANTTWTPAAKLISALGAVAVLWALLSTLIPGG